MDCIIYKATVKYFTGNIKNQKTIFEIEILFIYFIYLSPLNPQDNQESHKMDPLLPTTYKPIKRLNEIFSYWLSFVPLNLL